MTKEFSFQLYHTFRYQSYSKSLEQYATLKSPVKLNLDLPKHGKETPTPENLKPLDILLQQGASDLIAAPFNFPLACWGQMVAV